MAPKLFDIHLPFGISVPIFSYGLMILVGFLAAFLLVSRLGRKFGIPASKFADIGIVTIISGFLGAKISFFVTNPDLFRMFIEDFKSEPLHSLGFLSGGFDFFGGLILAIPTVYFFLRLWKLMPFAIGDIVAPGLAIAHAFGRIGCFMNGCCYGYRTGQGICFAKDSAVYYDQIDSGLIGHDAYQSLPVFPTQLLESALLFALCILLVFLFRKRSFAGQTFAIYVAGYGVIRFITQFTRGDESIVFGQQFTRGDESIVFPPFALWHLVAISVAIGGMLLYHILKKHAGNPLVFRKPVPETNEENLDPSS